MSGRAWDERSSGPGAALHARLAAALDGAGDRTGAELMAYLEREHAADGELLAECRALFETSEGAVPVLDTPLPGAVGGSGGTGAGAGPREVLESLHARLASHASGHGVSTMGGGTAGSHRVLPDRLGAYRVIRVLGEGGMGVVYEAEQSSPRRRVAVKVIRSAHAGPAARARFQNEAQALARLKHPCIAQVIEASSDAATGDAFFVMEFVDGPALTGFAERERLSVAERVELLAQVCDAVQHAHQKGVIHRDLKPANILVERADTGQPRPRVLDFGVARLTQGDEHAVTLAADARRIVGTLGYMAPEALDPGPEGVDTRADVYALGVILHELLTGELPIDVRGAALTEAARRVREQAPTRLSSLDRGLRGDLEVIASTALAKERERRYASAGELGADLRRYLRHEVIAAKPPSTLDALRKFVRRRRGLAAAAAGSTLVLVGATVFSTMQYLRAERARAAQAQQTARAEKATTRAEAVKRYFVSDIIAAAAPQRLGADAKVVDVLDDAYAALPERIAGDGELRAELRYEFSRAYDALGRYDAAIEAARKAADEQLALHGPDDIRTLHALNQVAVSLNGLGRWDEAEAVLKDLEARTRRLLPPEHEVRLRLASSYGNLLQSRGETGRAVPMLDEAAQIAEQTRPKDDGLRASIRVNLAAALMRAGDVDRAVREYGKLLEEQGAALSPSDPAVVSTLNNYVVGLLRLKRYDEAVTHAVDLVARVRAVYPSRHPAHGYALSTLTAAYHNAGKYEDAQRTGEEALVACRDIFGEWAWETEQVARRLVAIAVKRGKPEEARIRALAAQRIRCMASVTAEGETLARSFREEGKRIAPDSADAAALDLVESLAENADADAPAGHPRRVRYLTNVARAMFLLGVRERGEEVLALAQREAGGAADAETLELLRAVEAERKGSNAGAADSGK